MAETNTSSAPGTPLSHWDAIVIGSGIGGLAFAAIVARLRNWRVLVLERHFKIGGYTHTFSRRGFTWDVGLHYVGEMAPGMSGSRLFNFVTGGRVDRCPMPDVYDVFVYPGLSVKATKGREISNANLSPRFRRNTRPSGNTSATFKVQARGLAAA